MKHLNSAFLLALSCSLLLTGAAPGQDAATDGDWSAQYVRLTNTTQAAVMVRSGDIDNLGFGWPEGFDPFSGTTTPGHGYPFFPAPGDAQGTDRIMLGTGYTNGAGVFVDGYTTGTSRPENLPGPVTLSYPPPDFTLTGAVLQLFVDDFQPSVANSRFECRINGRRAPFLEATINTLAQTGPVGKLITSTVPPDFFPEIASGNLQIIFDDPATGVGDGFALDFARLLINPIAGGLPVGSVSGRVVHAQTGDPLGGVKVAFGNLSTLTLADGTYSLPGVNSGFAQIRAVNQGYTTSARQVDVITGQTTSGINFALAPGQVMLMTRPAVELSLPSIAGGLYVIQSSPDLSTWTDEETLSGTGGILRTFRPLESARRFWRVEER